jgi:hypothetical protein
MARSTSSGGIIIGTMMPSAPASRYRGTHASCYTGTRTKQYTAEVGDLDTEGRLFEREEPVLGVDPNEVWI